MRVLVVECDVHACWALAAALKDEGYEVSATTDAGVASKRLESFRPQAVLCDERAASMAQAARSAAGRPAVLLMSSADPPGARPAGVAAVIEKPIRLNHLLATLSRTLASKAGVEVS